MAYVDARVIQDRLDEVLGVENWQDENDSLPDGSVVCRLRLRLGDEWVTKVDVGSPSEQPDEHDRVKAAFSDALKRAAVKFGLFSAVISTDCLRPGATTTPRNGSFGNGRRCRTENR